MGVFFCIAKFAPWGARLISIHASYVQSVFSAIIVDIKKQFVDEVIHFHHNTLTSLHWRVDSHRFKSVNACVMRPTMASENDAEA